MAALMRRVMVVWLGLLLTAAAQAQGTTLRVGPGEAYSTIQAAINAANAGDTILIAAGIYQETLVIDKWIILQGAGRGKAGTVIAPVGSIGAAVTIQTGGNSATERLVIKNIFISGDNVTNGSGIEITSSGDIRHISLDGVASMYNDLHGLTLNVASPNFLSDLAITNCDFSGNGWNGLDCPAFVSLADVAVSGTSMNDNGRAGARLAGTITNLDISGVTFNRNERGMTVDGTVDGIRIKDSAFNDGQTGLDIFSPSGSITNVSIEDSDFCGNGQGIVIRYSNGHIAGVTVTGGEVSGSLSRGIELRMTTLLPTGSISNVIIENVSIKNNGGEGVANHSPFTVVAENNWWGDAGGPLAALGDGVFGSVDYEPWLTQDPVINILKLNVQDAPAYLQPGDFVVIDMDALNLAQHVVGCQAVLNFSSDYFKAGSGEVDVQPGGGIWNELIWNQWTTSGDLDVAVGVDLESAVGTKADGTVAKFTLTAKDADGTTQLVFRPDGDDNSSTYFADLAAQAVYPGSKIDSQTIVIDGTPPVIANLTAVQEQDAGPVDILNCANTTLQGVVEITVDADDALAGLAGTPAIEIAGPQALTAVCVDSEGPTFGWHAAIDANTANGVYTITITAADKAGNETIVTGEFCINKNEINGVVAMDTWTIAPYSFNRDVVFKATDTGGNVLKQWIVTVGFVNSDVNGIASGQYRLRDVPQATMNLSAKTNWTLRRKTAISFDGNSQGTAYFTGDKDLLGGDFNGSNTIQMLDFIVLRASWFTHNAVADINGDNNVQFSDFLIMRQNWFLTGDNE